MRAAELAQRLDSLERFRLPRSEMEQVVTPPEAAAELLLTALARGDLHQAEVADLGCGPASLAIGAAWLGAADVVAVDADPDALEVAKRNVASAGVRCRLLNQDVREFQGRVDTVLMNPPFGAQRRRADRPFWDAAFRAARRAVYAFSLPVSRTFIERRAVASGASIEAALPVSWSLVRTFPHHREAAVALPVDLWVLRKENTP